MNSTEANWVPATDDRWQHAVAVLDAATDTTVPFDTLVNLVLRREYRGDRDPTEHRRAVANALHYDTLPRLAEREVVRYDADTDEVQFDPHRVAAIHDGTEPGLDGSAATALPPSSPRKATRHRSA